MATYVFLNVPAYGHVNPTLAVAQELVRRGERVIYYLTEDFRAAVEATGATFRPYESQMGKLQPPANFNVSQGNFSPGSALPFMMVEESARVLPQVMERIGEEKPDYIVYEMMCQWGKIAARALHVPAILLRPSYAANEHFNMGTVFAAAAGRNQGAAVANAAGGPSPDSSLVAAFAQANERLAQLCRQYNVPPFGVQEIMMGAESLNIVFIPREFQPGGETFDERFVFVGPSIQDRRDGSDFPLEKISGQSVLYISLGTVFNNQAAFYNMCFAAFKDEPWQVVLSTGRKVDPAALDPIPDNFVVSPHVPQLEVLQRASLFVTHCGMNSTMESLYYGVPLVGVPQMPEQMMTARRIQELNLGLSLDKNSVTVETLRTTIEQAINNPTYRANAQSMQQHVRAAGGYQRAADAITHFAQTSGQTAPAH